MIQSLQKFIETHCATACVPVDLLKIARSVGIRKPRAGGGGGVAGVTGRLCLVVDGECCLDRLYGGYFSDWVCGGQWNRMVQFLAVLMQTVQNNNIELAVFFNGCLESQRKDEWTKLQASERKKISQVLKHVEGKGTPPPKIWWTAPVCLTTCLRMALRHLNITVLCTTDDHHQEVIAYCRENGFHGLMAEDAEYAIFDPPRYFSSEQLKLTYKGSLETKEFIMDEVAKRLDLNPNRFCVFAALLGNYLLTEEDLASFYTRICPDNKDKGPTETLIKAVCDFVRALPSVDNLDAIGHDIFDSQSTTLLQKFKECVQYYLNGTKDGFLRYRPPSIGRKSNPGHYVPAFPTTGNNQQAMPTDTAKFASETRESELMSLSAYKEATGAFDGQTPQIVIEPPNQTQIDKNSTSKFDGQQEGDAGIDKDATAASSSTTGNESGSANGTISRAPGSFGEGRSQVNGGLLLSSSSSSSSSPSCLSPDTSWTAPLQSKDGKSGDANGSSGIPPPPPPPPVAVTGGYPYQPQPTVCLPPVPPEVMRTASERHQKGLMSPWIYQVLNQGEMKIPVCMEEEVPDELPSSAVLYRPIRQMVYAILFNLHHQQFQAKQKAEQNRNNASTSSSSTSDKVADILVKEWVWTKYNQYRTPDLVKAEALGWPVPTVQRLWFGATIDDKKRRLRAFLTCMRSDTPLMLNTSYVPQHLLIMCCVLRYILSQSELRILRRQELNAFLAQAVSPRLMDAQFMQSMQLPIISARGVQLAALFMRGVECTLFANDACGAPIPWLMCCPWLFFDGKLFHYKLLKANEANNLLDVCEGQADQVMKVERMRLAILKGLKVEFARPPVPSLGQPRLHPHGYPPPPPPQGFLPAGAQWPPAGRARGANIGGRRAVLARGGQLEIAGVVVGSWGPNYGTGLRGRGGGAGGGGSVHVAPQVTSVGGPKRGNRLPYGPRYGSGGGGGEGGGGPPCGGGGGPGYPSVGMGRSLPTYSIRRPQLRFRRPIGVLPPAMKKGKRAFSSGGAGGAGGATASSSANPKANDSQSAVSGGGDAAASHSSAKGNVRSGPVSSEEGNATPANDGQFEDAANDSSKTVKASPTIMKKPTVLPTEQQQLVATTAQPPPPPPPSSSALANGKGVGDDEVESPDSGVNVSEAE